MLYRLFLFLCLYLPFQIALNPAEGIDLASGRIFILILTLVWLISALKNRKIFMPAKMQTALVLSFLFLNIFSLFWAHNLDWGMRKLLFLFSIFPIYFITADLLKSDFDRISLIKFVVWGAGLSAVIGLIQFSLQFIWGLDNILNFWRESVAPAFFGKSFAQAVLAYPSWLVNLDGKTVFRALSVFPDPHMFSIYLGMALPLAFGLFQKSTAGIERKKYLFLFLVILLADFLAFSRGGYFGLVTGLLFFLIFIIWNKKIDLRKIFSALALMLILLVFIFKSPVGNRFLTSFNTQEGSNAGRLETWKEAVNIIENNPLGIGLGNYSLERKTTAGYREPIYAHNLYLDIAAETGIINTLIWMALVIFAIISFIKKSKADILWLSGATSLVIFSAHSFFETAMFSTQILPFLLIIIALSVFKSDEK
jgi:O-antigen ligase